VGSDEKIQNAFADKWVQAHIQDSNDVLKKPILINEFGLNSRTVVGY
jgi:mannan endo-1,4-beta-mannosidase